MPYATPFQFSIEPGRPLLVLSCSEMKAAVGEEQLVRFGELYTGPLWQQVKAAGYPMTNVAAVSALYPILLKRGVIGYWTAAPTIVPEERNETMGINVAQEQAMVTGSFAGFDCPGADPLNYTEPTMYAKLEAMRLENKAKYAGTIFKPEQALV